MNKRLFTYKRPTFTSRISAEGILLDTTKYYMGDVQVSVDIVYHKGKIHHVYQDESIREIDVVTITEN